MKYNNSSRRRVDTKRVTARAAVASALATCVAFSAIYLLSGYFTGPVAVIMAASMGLMVLGFQSLRAIRQRAR